MKNISLASRIIYLHSPLNSKRGWGGGGGGEKQAGKQGENSEMYESVHRWICSLHRKTDKSMLWVTQAFKTQFLYYYYYNDLHLKKMECILLPELNPTIKSRHSAISRTKEKNHHFGKGIHVPWPRCLWAFPKERWVIYHSHCGVGGNVLFYTQRYAEVRGNSIYTSHVLMPPHPESFVQTLCKTMTG